MTGVLETRSSVERGGSTVVAWVLRDSTREHVWVAPEVEGNLRLANWVQTVLDDGIGFASLTYAELDALDAPP